MALIWWVWTALVGAQEPTAEQRRLQDELLKHAQRNGWPAVEKVYRRLLALEVRTPPRDHVLGAQAALQGGDVLLAWHRLRRAEPPLGGDPEMRAAYESSRALLEGIEARYGLISIYVREDKLPALARPEMPFSQEERDAIASVREHLRTERGYRGVLPAGRYSVDGHHFNVDADWTGWKVVVIGDPSTADDDPLVAADPSVPEPMEASEPSEIEPPPEGAEPSEESEPAAELPEAPPDEARAAAPQDEPRPSTPPGP